MLCALLLPSHWFWEARVLTGWNVFCLVNLLRLWPLLRLAPDDVAAHATREDETRPLAATLTTAAALVSLVGCS